MNPTHEQIKAAEEEARARVTTKDQIKKQKEQAEIRRRKAQAEIMSGFMKIVGLVNNLNKLTFEEDPIEILEIANSLKNSWKEVTGG